MVMVSMERTRPEASLPCLGAARTLMISLGEHTSNILVLIRIARAVVIKLVFYRLAEEC
jgi:hypothetical protein